MEIELFYFIISFALGMLISYSTSVPPKIVYKYPTPYNVGEITYKDKANTCYKYKVEKNICPTDKSKIRSYKLQ